MINARALVFVTLTLGCFATLTTSAEDADAEETVHRGIKAKPVKRTPPIYPKLQLRSGEQGWVQLNYVVNKDGEVVDPVVEESSGSRAFEKAALRTVKGWSYEPATWDGETVQQCQTKVMISFAIEGSETVVSRKFHRRYRIIDHAIVKGDMEKAGELLDETFAEFNMTLSEVAWLHALRARYAAVIGDEEMQLKAVRKATAGSGRWIDPKLYPKLLYVRSVMEFERRNLPDALDAYDKLVKLDSDMPELENLHPFADKVRNVVAGDSLISVSARIEGNDCDDCQNKWQYDPLRRKFRLADVDGELGDLELRCAWQRIVDKARPGKSWDLPDDWGNCSIIVFGEPGATFTLYEEPSA